MTKDSKTLPLTERQRKIAELYDGGLRTQKVVAAELGVSRATVARELRRVVDLYDEWDFAPNTPDIYCKAVHGRELTFDLEYDYAEGHGTISRSTAYRRTAKEWGYAPEQRDKPLHELKIAERAIGRALRAIKADGNEATPEAWAKRRQIFDLLTASVAATGVN